MKTALDFSQFALVQIGAMAEAQGVPDLQDRLQRITWSLGFEHFMLALQMDAANGKVPVHFIVSGYPPAWQKRYVDAQYIEVDPTVAHCQTRTTPLVWSENLITAKSRRMWDEAAAVGLKYGVSVPVHEQAGVTSMLSLARDSPMHPSTIQDVVRVAVVLAHTAHFAAAKFALPDIKQRTQGLLTEREKQVLRLLPSGKTDREIAEVLQIRARTVAFRVQCMLRKLNYQNRTELAAKAAQLGLI